MKISEVLALYDRELRREAVVLKGRREEVPELVRHIYDDPQRKSFIAYSELTEANAESVIEREIAYFQKLGRTLEWAVFGHDSLPELHLKLAAYGFEVEDEPESIMVLELAAAPANLLGPVTADVRRIPDPEGIDEVIAVEEAVWGVDYSWLKQKLISDLRERPDEIAIYLAYVTGKPASSGWIYFHKETHFASIWGGSTLEAYRQQGLYTALVAVRVQEAIRRGFSFLSIDAGPMSGPIVGRLGFQLLTTAVECNLQPGGGPATN